MRARLTVCDTCAFDRKNRTFEGRTGGELLAERVEALAAGLAQLEVRRHSCLMGCEHSCNIALQAHGKISYVLGNFRPTAEAAAGIVDYALLYAASEAGLVPFRQWPKAVKGHFIARLPPTD